MRSAAIQGNAASRLQSAAIHGKRLRVVDVAGGLGQQRVAEACAADVAVHAHVVRRCRVRPVQRARPHHRAGLQCTDTTTLERPHHHHAGLQYIDAIALTRPHHRYLKPQS